MDAYSGLLCLLWNNIRNAHLASTMDRSLKTWFWVKKKIEIEWDVSKIPFM